MEGFQREAWQGMDLHHNLCTALSMLLTTTFWQQIRSQSTVMLTVDVSFLLVPSSNVQTSYTVTIIMAYLSTFCVVGSLVVSIILAGRNRKYGSVSASSAVRDTPVMFHVENNNYSAGCISHQHDEVDVWWQSAGNYTQSSVCATYVGVSILQSNCHFRCSSYHIIRMIFFIAAFTSLVFRSTPTVLLGVSGCGFIIIFLLTLWPVWSRRYHVFTWLRKQLPSFGN